MAYLITVDGISGAGKTTQINLLEHYIRETYGMEVHRFKEPTDFIRQTLKEYRRSPKAKRDPLVETYLFIADRRNQFICEIEPLLNEDCVILMDRSKYSAYAYQGKDIALEHILELNSFFPDSDLALFLLCEPETAVERIKSRGKDKSADEVLEYVRTLKSRFETVASVLPNVYLVNSEGGETAVFHQLRSHVDALLGREMNRVVFLDKDGVLVDYDIYPEKIPTDELYPQSIEALKMLKQEGYLLYLISNQSWISKGRMTPREVEAGFESIQRQCAAQGVEIDGYLYCPHTKDEGCACKKPGTAMLEQIAEEVNCDVLNSYIIGDSASDIEAGNKMGLRTILVETGSPPEEKGGCAPNHNAHNILHAAEIICNAAQSHNI